MKKKIISLLLMCMCVVTMSACSKKDNSEVTETTPTTTIEEKQETTKEVIQETTKQTVTETTAEVNRYSVAGIDNAAEFEGEFKTIQSLISNNEKEKVAEYINYPLRTPSLTVNSKSEFIKNYDTIMTKKVKDAMVNQKVQETVVNYKGVMVGAGDVWLTVVDGSNSNGHKYLINAIN